MNFKETRIVNKRNEILKTAHVNGCFLTGSRTLIEKIGYFKVFPYKYGHELKYRSNKVIICNMALNIERKGKL